MKRGHSNVYAERTEACPGNDEKARIPLEGGGNVYTVRELPPLILTRDEWEEIGVRMGWTVIETAIGPMPCMGNAEI